MAILLLFVNLFAIYYANLLRINYRENFYTKLRVSFIYSSLIFSVFVFFQIQLLSFFNALNFSGICLSHLLLMTVTIVYILKQKNKNQPGTFSITLTAGQWFVALLLLLIFFIPLLYQCLYVPPNNSDASTCYLIRTEYWIKNQNILPYPTQNLFEIYYNRFPQFFTVNARILSGGDYFTSIFQFFAYIGCIITVSLITKELGGKNPKAQMMAAIICMCIPQAILQSSAAMYDLQSAFAATVAILFLVRLLKNPKNEFNRNLLIFSIAFAFTSYIKYSTIFFIALFPVLAVFILLRKHFWKAVKFAMITGGVFLAVHFSFFYENYNCFGSIISPPTKNGHADNLLNERRDIGTLISGITKNFAINLVTPSTAINENLYKGVQNIHRIIRTDINDPEINLNDYYEKYSSAISESTSGNLNTTLLIIVAFVILLWRILAIKKNEYLLYITTACLIGGFIFFCVVFKFQSWNARLQLPFFILITAPVAVLISGSFLFRKFFRNAILVFCVVTALPFIYMNYGKPIISYKDIRQVMNKPPSVINATEFDLYSSASCLKSYYHLESTSSFLHMNTGLNEEGKRDAFACLESVDYFKNEKSVFEKTRNQNYLVPGYQNSALLLSSYETVCKYLYSTIKSDTINIGLVLGHSPEYPLMAMLRDYPSSKKINWSHIRYYDLKNENRNFEKTFYYTFIVTNDSNFKSQIHIPVKNIQRIGLIELIELEKSDSSCYRLEI